MVNGRLRRAVTPQDSEAPTRGLHRLGVVGLVGLLRLGLVVHDVRVLRVVPLVGVASCVLAVHGLALQATVVLLLLHAAAHVLLGAGALADEARLVQLGAGVAVLHGADLVGLGQGVVAAGAGVLLTGAARGSARAP